MDEHQLPEGSWQIRCSSFTSCDSLFAQLRLSNSTTHQRLATTKRPRDDLKGRKKVKKKRDTKGPQGDITRHQLHKQLQKKKKYTHKHTHRGIKYPHDETEEQCSNLKSKQKLTTDTQLAKNDHQVDKYTTQYIKQPGNEWTQWATKDTINDINNQKGSFSNHSWTRKGHKWTRKRYRGAKSSLKTIEEGKKQQKDMKEHTQGQNEAKRVP